ncbi:ABC transporter ATP-binding protein [Alloiococcus sp. CFN-8]|uniref:ABC transporter ATP-binding protein n=1 Tax=Alloiococcus sp. CFN-8 TaxID=3416081 RepID=UPI003CF0F7E6
MIKKLLPYISNYKLYAILSPLAIIAEVLLEIRIPLLMSKIVDIGIQNQDINYVIRTGITMVIMALLALVCGALSAFFSAKASVGFGTELRREQFNKIQNFSFSNINKFSTPSLVTRLTTDVMNTQNAFMMIIRILVRAPFMLVSATIVAFTINRSLVSVFLIAIPVLAVGLFLIASAAFPRFTALLKRYDSLNSSVQENLISMRVVKAFVRSDYEKEKFKEANDGLMKSSIRAEKVVIFNMPLMQLTIYSCIIAILWFGGNKILSGTMKTGELISFITYVTQILISLMMISMVFINIVLSRASVSRIVEILDEEIDITDENAVSDLQVADGSVEFRNVSFKYNPEAEDNVLENINLKINSGETIGIIGGTGSSKSSLVQLIPRLYDVTEGEMLVAGHNVKDYKLRTLRDAVSMVLQKNVLFSGTISDNLKWGNENATDEEIIAACKAAQAHDFITSFPDGYDTDLGQGGVNVSGGQKQRLTIARALLKNPKILILDDSTSAVDTATDAKIREAFKNSFKDVTKIIIAQRITSVSDADKIIVLDDGKINGIGTHEELLKNNEIYQDVYNSQQKGEEN